MTPEIPDEQTILLRWLRLLQALVLDDSNFMRQVFETLQEKYGVHVSDYAHQGYFDFDSFVLECHRKKESRHILN